MENERVFFHVLVYAFPWSLLGTQLLQHPVLTEFDSQ